MAAAQARQAFSGLAGIALLAALWGAAVAVAGVNALILCIAMIACAFILVDFRIGVVLLILLMPVSASPLMPNAMLGITGLNPLNLLLLGTLGSCLLHGLSDRSLRGFLPRPLLWLFIVPILAAGALGAQHVGEIVPAFHAYELIAFQDAAGYARDLVAKPLSMVLFALLVGAAVSKSAQPEKFLLPMMVSIAVVGLGVLAFVAQSGVALHQLASSTAREFLSTLGMHANDQGRLYAFAYALLLFTWAEAKAPGLRAALLATMALTATALVLTFSRGAFGAFFVVNVLFLFWRRSLKTLFLFGLAASIALFALPTEINERLSSGGGEGLDAISAGRIDWLWLPLLPEVLRSPVYGSGLGSILWSQPMRVGGGESVLLTTHPHNAYLQALLDTGALGLLLLCAYFTHVYRKLRMLGADPAMDPALRGYFQGAAAGLLGFLAASFTDGSLMPRPEQALLWLAIGMMYGQLHKRRAP
jgi:O-antigen ligase